MVITNVNVSFVPKLTYPYFHDGAVNTLEKAVDTIGMPAFGTRKEIPAQSP